MYSYNRGEWAEFYAKLKMLADRGVIVGDKNLEKTDNAIEILAVSLNSTYGECWYYSNEVDSSVAIISGEHVMDKVEFDKTLIPSFFAEIVNGEGRSFRIPVIESSIASLKLENIKTNAQTKADVITRAILPQEDTPRDELGFTIKSCVGGSNSLLNASQSTNIIYKVSGYAGNIEDANSISPRQGKVMARLQYLKDNGATLSFSHTASEQFYKNLRLVDSEFPNMLAKLVLKYYSTTGNPDLSSIVCQVSRDNNPWSQEELEYKLKFFIRHIALGMVPTKAWTGNTVTGGCIIVNVNGELLGYSLYDEAAFDELLYRFSKFDTASTSRHKFGKLFEQDGELYFALNTLIRIF